MLLWAWCVLLKLLFCYRCNLNWPAPAGLPVEPPDWLAAAGSAWRPPPPRGKEKERSLYPPRPLYGPHPSLFCRCACLNMSCGSRDANALLLTHGGAVMQEQNLLYSRPNVNHTCSQSHLEFVKSINAAAYEERYQTL